LLRSTRRWRAQNRRFEGLARGGAYSQRPVRIGGFSGKVVAGFSLENATTQRLN
jgi:hypothetical protein